MNKAELFKSLKEINLSQSQYGGFSNIPFGVYIKDIVKIHGEHCDYLKNEEAKFILLCLNNRDIILNVLEDNLMMGDDK